uniref:Secreted protein n=1 Tax=Haemonchus contortus TaxID=6289 RepID=A0A7I4YHT9_HAECO
MQQYYTSSPVAKMFYAFVLPLVFPFFTYVEAQYGAYNPWNPYGPNYNPSQQNPYQYNDYNRWNPFSPNFNPIPPGTFQGGVFSPDWGKKLQERIEQEVKSSLEHSGVGNGNGNIGVINNNGGLVITTENGQTVVKATIGGKSYTATFPGTNTSISTFTTTNYNNGQLEHIFKITVNNETYTYTTINGKTTVTNGQGQPVSDGGPFKVTLN